MGFLLGLIVGLAFGGGKNTSHYNARNQVYDEDNEMFIQERICEEEQRRLADIRRTYRDRPELEAAFDIHKETWPDDAEAFAQMMWEQVFERRRSTSL